MGLAVWTIYDKPSDFPDCYVARLHEDGRPTEQVLLCQALEPLRQFLSGHGLHRFPRDTADEPHIVETWL